MGVLVLLPGDAPPPDWRKVSEIIRIPVVGKEEGSFENEIRGIRMLDGAAGAPTHNAFLSYLVERALLEVGVLRYH